MPVPTSPKMPAPIRAPIAALMFALSIAVTLLTSLPLTSAPSPLDDALAAVLREPPARRAAALAADVSQEGHWTFVNAAGERFTTASPEELKRVLQILAIDATRPGTRLLLVVSANTAFNHRSLLAALPLASAASTDVMVSIAGETYPVISKGSQFFAATRPGLAVELSSRRLFDEANWQLAHPLRRNSIRIVALEPGGPTSITASPQLDAQTKRPLTDTIAPGSLVDALRGLRAQTVILTARRDGAMLAFRPSSGPELTLPAPAIAAAAEAADVNLVVLNSASPRQPGTRGWLWQKTSVSRLDDAVARDHLADFLNALVPPQGRLLISAAETNSGRIRLSASQLPAEASLTKGLTDTLSDMVSSIAGQVTVTSVEASLRARERQGELDRRVVPWLPSWLQFAYLGLFALGLAGHGVARVWWHKLWPPEQRDAYSNVFGYQSARALRALAYALIYLPLTAIASAPVALARLGRRRAMP